MALERAGRRAWDGRAWWSQGVLLEGVGEGAPAEPQPLRLQGGSLGWGELGEGGDFYVTTK